MSESNGKKPELKPRMEAIEIRFPMGKVPFDAVLSEVAKQCHGPKVEVPMERLELRDTTITFTCGFGHLHKFVLIVRGDGTLGLQGTPIELPTNVRAKAERPVLFGADGGVIK